jgi:hypothetical protein
MLTEWLGGLIDTITIRAHTVTAGCFSIASNFALAAKRTRSRAFPLERVNNLRVGTYTGGLLRRGFVPDPDISPSELSDSVCIP